MARNGHPRVPRKIRGERRRRARLIQTTGYRFGLPVRRTDALAAWERELLDQRSRSVILHTTGEVLRDTYGPMINAALQAPLSLPTPMSQRG